MRGAADDANGEKETARWDVMRKSGKGRSGRGGPLEMITSMFNRLAPYECEALCVASARNGKTIDHTTRQPDDRHTIN